MKRSQPRKPPPRGCIVLIGIAFFLSGLAGLIVLLCTLVPDTIKVRAWDAVPCTVLRAEVEPKGTDMKGKFQSAVKTELTWEYKGTRYTGGKLDADTGFHAAEGVNAQEELCHHLRRRPQQTCHVNPGDPSEAILRLPAWWPVFAFCGGAVVFLIVGVAVLRSARRISQTPRTPGTASRPGLCVALFMGIMTMAGGGAVWWFAIRGATDWSAVSERMKEVPCTIAASAVDEHRSSSRSGSSVTYHPEITFRYEWDGRTWHSEWLNFNKSPSSHSARSEAEATVRHYRRSSTHTCWVDPEQPWVAVLEKTTAKLQWLWIPVAILVLVGAGLAFYALRKLGTLPRSAGPPPLPE